LESLNYGIFSGFGGFVGNYLRNLTFWEKNKYGAVIKACGKKITCFLLGCVLCNVPYLFNRMIVEELTEYFIASQIDVQFRSYKYWIASGEASCKDSNPSSKA
jgi:hypothetical protein